MSQKVLTNNIKFSTFRSILNNNFLDLIENITLTTSITGLNLYTVNNKDTFKNVREKLNYNFLTIYKNLTSVL